MVAKPVLHATFAVATKLALEWWQKTLTSRSIVLNGMMLGVLALMSQFDVLRAITAVLSYLVVTVILLRDIGDLLAKFAA